MAASRGSRPTCPKCFEPGPAIDVQCIGDPDDPDYASHLLRDGDPPLRIETISNATLRAFTGKKYQGLGPYSLLERTYDMAHRQAMRVNDALDEVLASLQGAA